MTFYNLYWWRERRRERKTEWGKWFAWYPVRLGSFCNRSRGKLSPINTYLDSRTLVWFQCVLRRKILESADWDWEYKPLE